MEFTDFSRGDEIAAARSRRFDTLTLDERERPMMPDPQQASDYDDEVRLVVPGAGSMRAMVEAVNLPSMARRPRAEHLGAPAVLAQPELTPAQVAAQLIAEARDTARTMLSQAREVITAERAQAVRQGHDEGFAQGLAAADQETAGLIATCERIGINVMEERERVLAEGEADLVELAMAIARRIVNAAIDVDETLVVEACRGAMRKAFQRGALQVLAHPDDLTLLRAAGPGLAGELGGVEHLDFVEERRLDRGSIIVRTPAGEIDATIAGKADKIEQALREGIEQRRAERNAAA